MGVRYHCAEISVGGPVYSTNLEDKKAYGMHSKTRHSEIAWTIPLEKIGRTYWETRPEKSEKCRRMGPIHQNETPNTWMI